MAANVTGISTESFQTRVNHLAGGATNEADAAEASSGRLPELLTITAIGSLIVRDPSVGFSLHQWGFSVQAFATSGELSRNHSRLVEPLGHRVLQESVENGVPERGEDSERE